MTDNNDTNQVYIAREIHAPTRGSIRIDEEGVFSSFEEAQSFLKHLREDGDYQTEPSPSDEYFRHEIIKYRLNDYENWNIEIRWTYKLNGELITKVDAKDEIPIAFESISFQSLFEPGEIVRIKSNFEEPDSFMARGNYGVIDKIPDSKESWEASVKPLDEWDGSYLIWLISQDTHLLYHEHLYEICVDKFDGKLPEDLHFLNILSDYIKNDGNVPYAEKIKKTFSENIVVRKINYFFGD